MPGRSTGPTERSLDPCPGLVTIDEVGVRHVSRSYDRRSITASAGINLAVKPGEGGAAARSLVDVSAVANRKLLDNEAVVFDDAQGTVAADAVAPLT